MPFWLSDDLIFPPAAWATDEGVVALGGDLTAERLVLAYSQGIFPWPHEGMPLLWFSPDPRFVLRLEDAHVPRSLRKVMRQTPWEVRADTAFDAVMQACSAAARPGQGGTWITDELRAGFCELHRRGFAHSIETWRDSKLVGGLYGVSLGRAFFGESMFTRVPDASKIALVTLLANLADWKFAFIDCQVETRHLARFGAKPVARAQFLTELHAALSAPARLGPWELGLGAKQAATSARGRSDL